MGGVGCRSPACPPVLYGQKGGCARRGTEYGFSDNSRSIRDTGIMEVAPWSIIEMLSELLTELLVKGGLVQPPVTTRCL